MARLYTNENFPFLTVSELRRLGRDVLTVRDAGKASLSTPDSEVPAFADAQPDLTGRLIRVNRPSTSAPTPSLV